MVCSVADEFESDDYFLAAANPLATVDQRDAEALALRIVTMPAVQTGKQAAQTRIRTIIGEDGTEEGWKAFDDFMDEWAFSYTLKAINSDPNYPKIVQIFTLPHEWFGRRVPGSRAGGGPGPDQA